MKINGMVLGVEVIRNSSEPGKRDGIVKLIIAQNTTAKVTTPLLSMLSGKTDISKISEELHKQQQLKYIYYITIGEYIEHKYNIGSHVELDIKREDDSIYRGVKDDNQ